MTQHHYGEYGCGAMALPPDARDHRMERIPGVAAVLAAEIPQQFSLAEHVKSIYQQGAIPGCVMASFAVIKSIQDQEEHGAWNTYDWLSAYHDVGGDDRHGVPARRALKYIQEKGLQVEGGRARYRIGSYSFAPQQGAEQWVATVKAAICAGEPVAIAARLPAVLGWDSEGEPGDPYHQFAAPAYDEEYAICVNTWGPGWGRRGWFRLRWSYLTAGDFQHGDVYAAVAVDALDDYLPDEEPQPVRRPEPAPSPLVVTGYLGPRETLIRCAPGALLSIVGDGFDVGVIQATCNGVALEVVERQARLLTARVPTTLNGQGGPVTVRREGVTVDGPLLLVR